MALCPKRPDKNMYTKLIFAILIGQATLDYPKFHDFKPVKYEIETMYTFLTGYSNMGKTPIVFLASNTSADYSSKNWMDPCYDRFYEVGAQYVVYWIVNKNAYCEALVRQTNKKESNKPTFELEYLFRVERKNTWCPTN